MEIFDSQWFVENLLTEIIFGLIFIPVLILGGKLFYERFFKARRIVYILSLCNNPSRAWRKGVYAADRFMDIYESKTGLNSDKTLMHYGGDGGGVWWNEYLDSGILAKYGLVTIFEENGGKRVKATNAQLTKTVYRILKKRHDKENYSSEQYRLNTKRYRD